MSRLVRLVRPIRGELKVAFATSWCAMATFSQLHRAGEVTK